MKLKTDYWNYYGSKCYLFVNGWIKLKMASFKEYDFL